LLYGKDAIEQYRRHPDWVEPTLQGAQENDIPLIDMLPILQNESSSALTSYYVAQRDHTFGHMSGRGNFLVASTIASKMRELSWFPRGD